MDQLQTIQGAHEIIQKDLASRIRAILDAGTSENTKRAYQSDLEYMSVWARLSAQYELSYPVPLELVLQFITDHVFGMPHEIDEQLVSMGIKAKIGPHSIATVCRRIASLSTAHEAQRLPNPCRSKQVTTLLSKVRRVAINNGIRPNKKRALTKDLLSLVLNTCTDTLIGIRDCALLSFQFIHGHRRSEVAHAMFRDLTPIENGYIYRMPFSKTDQAGNGVDLPVIGKAGISLEAWLNVGNITSGRIFRSISKSGVIGESISEKAISDIVKRRAKLAGLDPSLFSSHSLRSGLITTAGMMGISLNDTMAITQHRSIRIAMGYYQTGNIIQNPISRILD